MRPASSQKLCPPHQRFRPRPRAADSNHLRWSRPHGGPPPRVDLSLRPGTVHRDHLRRHQGERSRQQIRCRPQGRHAGPAGRGEVRFRLHPRRGPTQHCPRHRQHLRRRGRRPRDTVPRATRGGPEVHRGVEECGSTLPPRSEAGPAGGARRSVCQLRGVRPHGDGDGRERPPGVDAHVVLSDDGRPEHPLPLPERLRPPEHDAPDDEGPHALPLAPTLQPLRVPRRPRAPQVQGVGENVFIRARRLGVAG